MSAPDESSEQLRRPFPGGGGSGRDPQLHAAILHVARELLLEVGYARLTIDAVARRARVGKPTVYRWWRNKAQLIHEAIQVETTPSEPDTGDLELDLTRWILRVVQHVSRPEFVAALPGLLADVAADRTTASWIDDVSQPGLEHLARILSQAGFDRALCRTVGAMVIGGGMFYGTAPVDASPRDWDTFAASLTIMVLAAIRGFSLEKGSNLKTLSSNA